MLSSSSAPCIFHPDSPKALKGSQSAFSQNFSFLLCLHFHQPCMLHVTLASPHECALTHKANKFLTVNTESHP